MKNASWHDLLVIIMNDNLGFKRHASLCKFVRVGINAEISVGRALYAAYNLL